MAAIYHWHHHVPEREGHGNVLATLRALVGGLMAILILVAMLSAFLGGTLYLVVKLTTRLFS
ncbi:hypothetical protein [Nocardioides sp. CER19]|uniref:hypothetical protein n=1 Tax=Nocardioides sp. CER19 TaxID=3038538 RepID=UPI00244A6B5B|nr:hypothetical protein [Nocardioides sp. CER19]MDH2416590.1 hypothetical protein [Nocardioides sp. CER19]